MSNFDGIAESALIFAQLESLCEGRVYRELPDDDALERYSDGQVKPYIDLSFSVPVPAARGRSIGWARAQPYVFQVNAAVVSGGRVVTDEAAADVTNRLLGWSPNTNTGGLTVSGGAQFTTTNSGGAPSRRIKIVRMEAVINLSPVFQ